MLEVYTISEKMKWDTIVKSFNDYDVYFLSGYVKAFQLHGDGEPLLLYWNTKSFKGINVVMKRDISCDERFTEKLPKENYYDLSTPYGYGGWLFEGEASESSYEEFAKAYAFWCSENNIISEFVRFHPVLENAKRVNDRFYDVVFLGNTVAIMLDDEEEIWARFTSKNRSHIRVAKKEGVMIKTDTSKGAFEEFQRIYETTMNHDDASSYYYFDNAFFESIRNDLKGNYMIFTAYLDGKAIASSIMLFSGKYMNYHLSGQLFEFRRYAGTNMILHEAANWGCHNGYEWLHLGGGLGAKEGSLYDFKKSFYKKGDDKEFYIGRKIFNKEVYDKLVSMRDEELDSGFFPKYRA